MKRRFAIVARMLTAVMIAGFFAGGLLAQVPQPKEAFGFDPGEDYKLADYGELLAYYRQLAEASDRFHLEEIGSSTQGRPMVVAFISSSANLANLDQWRSISSRLARARDVSDSAARELAREGRAIVWIDSGLHSTEVAHSQHGPHLAYHMVTDEGVETRRIRENVILMFMPMMNPDGHEVVVDWYRSQLGSPYETTRPPVLYHEYVGHDNNRDWYMLLQTETQNLAKVAYREWYPQILLNHHQTAPFPARIHIGPFADPLNPTIPPMIVRGVNLLGTYMAHRLEEEGMPGVLSRRRFDMWRADGTRYAPYYRNIIGLHTEVGHASATPQFHHPDSLPDAFPGEAGVEFLSAREPSVFYPNPWQGGWARLSHAVQYHFISSLAVLDYASRFREEVLYNMHKMARDAIEAGDEGNPYAYIVPPDQWDPGEAVEMINALLRGGVEVHRASAPFQAGGRTYSAGSYVIRTGQPFRALVQVLLEPQQYPERRLSPDGPLDPPRDLAGWTMSIQMGVRTDRIDDPFDAELVRVDSAAVEPGTLEVANRAWGFALARNQNASVLAANRLLASGEEVSMAESTFEAGGHSLLPGTLLIRNQGSATRDRIAELARELGLDFHSLPAAPTIRRQSLRFPRVGMYKSWVANMDEGWTRWMLKRYDLSVDSLVDSRIRAGRLDEFDVIVLPDQGARTMLSGHPPGSMPSEFTGGLGEEGASALRRFVETGRTIVALDGASDFVIEHFDLPIRNVVESLGPAEFFIPGSLLRLHVDTSHPLAYGMPDEAAAFFVRSRAFEVQDGVASSSTGSTSIRIVARYSEEDLLLSGLASGAEHIEGRAAVIEVVVGEGRVFLVGFRPQFRAQSRGTFKFLLNGILHSTDQGSAATTGGSSSAPEDAEVFGSALH